MIDETKSDEQLRIHELERENARLRVQLERAARRIERLQCDLRDAGRRAELRAGTDQLRHAVARTEAMAERLGVA